MSKDVLFVCSGNTCRSPMAMAIFNTLSKEKKALSAGISVAYPSAAAENAKEAVKKYGASLDEHMSKQITPDDLKEYSLIITMTNSHKEFLRTYLDDDKIITLAEFAGENGDVSDPYGGNSALYEDTAQMIYEYIKKGLENTNDCTLAKSEDAQKLAEMEKKYFSDAWSEKIIADEVAKERVIVIKDKENIVGYCIFMIAADEGEILRIAVDNKQRKKGYGKKLLSFAIDEMKKHNAISVFLEVRAANRAARALYHSIGFEEIGKRTNYYTNPKEDAIIYKLEIKER